MVQASEASQAPMLKRINNWQGGELEEATVASTSFTWNSKLSSETNDGIWPHYYGSDYYLYGLGERQNNAPGYIVVTIT